MSEISEVNLNVNERQLKYLSRMAKKPPVEIEFQDLKYSLSGKEESQILNSISGKFRCGELTAIMGASGAGKSALLNKLVGYTTSGEGIIKLNGFKRNPSTIKNVSSYIMQENIIQPYLNVKEAVTYAACLKLGTHVKYQDKVAVVEEVINLLGLEECMYTRTENLSGGQKKRLAIATELVNNPPIIFLDEPTTGLDDFAVKQCIDLLKKISNLNRTVVCTIHQPSSSLFQYFSQVYVMAEGCCVYAGSPSQILPFLLSAGYVCPSNYTPADYIIELVYHFPSTVDVFKKAIQNGKLCMKDVVGEETFQDTHDQEILENVKPETMLFQSQLYFLLSRQLLQMKRNKPSLFLQLFNHLSLALIIAGIFMGIGNDGSQTITIFKFCLCCNVFFAYTHVMTPVVGYPFEVELLKREYFNSWYNLRTYFCATTISTLPFMLILSILFSIIVYYLTDQPKETNRLFGFTLICVLIAMTSQGMGYLIGTIFSVTKGSVAGPSVLAILVLLSVYGLGQKTITPLSSNLSKISFLRHGILGLCSTLFYERKLLPCKELYCHYNRPEFLMKDNSLPLTHYKHYLPSILFFFVLFRVMWFFALKCVLNTELSAITAIYVRKIINIRTRFH